MNFGGSDTKFSEVAKINISTMEGLKQFFSVFVLDPKREYPRFQVVNFEEINSSNIEQFMNQLTSILAVQERLTNTKDESERQELFLSIQNHLNLSPTSNQPRIHLAMSKSEAVIGAMNIDVKKIKKIIAALAREMSQASLRTILDTLVDLYSKVPAESISADANFRELFKIREEAIKTFGKMLNNEGYETPRHPPPTPLASTSYSAQREEVTSPSVHYTKNQHLFTPLPETPTPQELAPGISEQEAQLTNQGSHGRPPNNQLPPPPPPPPVLSTASKLVTTDTPSIFERQLKQRMEEMRPDKGPLMADMPSSAVHATPLMSVWSDHHEKIHSNPMATYSMPLPPPTQQINHTRSPTYVTNHGVPVTSGPIRSTPSGIQAHTSPHPFNPQPYGAPSWMQYWPVSNGPPQATSLATGFNGQTPPLQPSAAAASWHQILLNPPPAQPHPSLQTAHSSSFVTLRTAPLPSLPTFSGDKSKDKMGVGEFVHKFASLASMYGAPHQLLIYLETCLQEHALNWYKFYVSTNPLHGVEQILAAMQSQFETPVSSIQRFKIMESRVQGMGEPLQHYFSHKLRLIADWNKYLPDNEVCEFLWDGLSPTICKDTRQVSRSSVQSFTTECIRIEAENKRIAHRSKTSFSGDITAIERTQEDSSNLELVRDMLHCQIGKSSKQRPYPQKYKYKKSPYPSKNNSRHNSRPTSRQSSRDVSRNGSSSSSRAGSRSRYNSRSPSRTPPRQDSRNHSRDRKSSPSPCQCSCKCGKNKNRETSRKYPPKNN